MIRAVFFDFFNTLAYYEPPREQVYIDTCKEHGIVVEEKALSESLPMADLFWRNENVRFPINDRSPEEKVSFWSDYVIKALSGASIHIEHDFAKLILSRMQQIKWGYQIFSDVLSTLGSLKEQGFILGLVSNIGQNMDETYQTLGLQPYLDCYVSSYEVGFAKPQPEIFQIALQKAKVNPDESLYIGDQYAIDIVGARKVGMEAVLIDRRNWYPDRIDCPRILSMTEIVKFLSSSR